MFALKTQNCLFKLKLTSKNFQMSQTQGSVRNNIHDNFAPEYDVFQLMVLMAN